MAVEGSLSVQQLTHPFTTKLCCTYELNSQELKNEFNKKDADIQAVAQKGIDLKKFIDKALLDSIAKSFDEIHKMFRGRHPIPPRICLKANLGKDDKTIVSLARERRVAYNSDCLVHENTGFEFIQNNGANYLCQNIPEHAKKDAYKNPRLIMDEVKLYSNTFNYNGHIDENWVKCWRGGKDEKEVTTTQDYQNCYKSTLIIPLTLWNNKLGDRFIEKFRMKDVDRTIFGYLCLDHISTDYFKPVFDVDSGYVYADILSLYLLVRFVYIDQSKTFNDASEQLSKNGITINDHAKYI